MIRSCLIFLFLLITMLACSASAQQSIAVQSSDEKAIRKFEDDMSAAIASNDADGLDRLLAPECTFVYPDGHVQTKAKRLAMVRSGQLKAQSYSRDEETILVYGNTAVVRYRSISSGEILGQQESRMRRVINVLVKKESHWQMVAHESTSIVERPNPDGKDSPK